MKRTQLFWGVALLLMGGVMLANAMGIKLPNGSSLMEIFWPLLLIFAGVWILAGIFMRGNIETEEASIDLQGAASAKVTVNHGAGEIRIHSGTEANQLVRGSFVGGLDYKARLNGDQLEVRMNPARDLTFPFPSGKIQFDWDVALNASIPTALHLNIGAAKSIINLRDMNITHLDLDTGASETEITLPERGRFTADLDFGAASIVVVIPEGLAARIHSTVVAGDLNISTSRFPRSDNGYKSPDFDTAPNTVDLKINGAAASIKIR